MFSLPTWLLRYASLKTGAVYSWKSAEILSHSSSHLTALNKAIWCDDPRVQLFIYILKTGSPSPWRLNIQTGQLPRNTCRSYWCSLDGYYVRRSRSKRWKFRCHGNLWPDKVSGDSTLYEIIGGNPSSCDRPLFPDSCSQRAVYWPFQRQSSQRSCPCSSTGKFDTRSIILTNVDRSSSVVSFMLASSAAQLNSAAVPVD